MASEIRVNNIKALTGLGTVTVSADGLNVGGIVTATSFSGPFSGDLSIEDKIVHTGDTNTAIRFPAADTFTVETSGSEALRVDSNGFIGINTSSPGNHNDGGTGGTNLVIGATGVGRGTLQFVSEQTGGADEPLGIVNFVDVDTTNSSDRGARILGLRGADANSAYLRFETANSGAPVERVRITSTGGVHFSNAEFIERVNITAGKISDNLQVSLDNGMVHYFTTTETTTSDPNIVSTAGINTSMATGDTMAVTLINTAAAAGYSPRIKIDGVYTGITTHWSGGSAPTEGSSSGSDVYAYQIVKTGDAAYRVFASFTNFA